MAVLLDVEGDVDLWRNQVETDYNYTCVKPIGNYSFFIAYRFGLYVKYV